MDGKDNNETRSSENALQTRENAALMNEVRNVEDRIDIATMEIEDLEDYCAMMAGEIQFLRSRLEKSPDFIEASDRRFTAFPANSLETFPDREYPAEGSSAEKMPDVLSGDPYENLPEYQPEQPLDRDSAVWESAAGENALDPFAPSEEEDKRTPKPEKAKKKKKKKTGQEDQNDHESTENAGDAPKEPEPVIITPAYRELLRDPEAEAMAAEAADADDKSMAQEAVSPEEPAAEPMSGEISGGREEKTENINAAKSGPDDELPKRRFSFWGDSGRSRRKKNAERIYCPNCGSFVGEERKCPWCHARVK